MISNLSQVIPATLPKTRDAAPVIAPSTAGGAVVDPVQGSAVADSSGSVQRSAVGGVQGRGTHQNLADAVDKLNSKVQNLNRNLEFSMDKDSGELVVKVVDAKTHEVIRQIPRKEALELAHSIEQYMQDHHLGLVKTKA